MICSVPAIAQREAELRPLTNPVLFAFLAALLAAAPGFGCGYVLQSVRGADKPLPWVTPWIAGGVAAYLAPWTALGENAALLAGVMAVGFGVACHLGARYRRRRWEVRAGGDVGGEP